MAEERRQISRMKEMSDKYPLLIQQVNSNGKNIEAIANELRSLVNNFGNLGTRNPDHMEELMEFKRNASMKLDELEKFSRTEGPKIEALSRNLNDFKGLMDETLTRMKTNINELTESCKTKDQENKKLIKDIQDQINPMMSRIVEGIAINNYFKYKKKS